MTKEIAAFHYDELNKNLLRVRMLNLERKQVRHQANLEVLDIRFHARGGHLRRGSSLIFILC